MSQKPATGEYFLASVEPGTVFHCPKHSETRDFGRPVGLCIQALRCEWTNPWETIGGADIWPSGDRQWVQVPSITKVFLTGGDALAHLFPSMNEPPAGLAPGDRP